MGTKPYTDERISDNSFRRTFSATVDAGLLVWHRDRKARLITVEAGEGWQLQFDDKLPFMLVAGAT